MSSWPYCKKKKRKKKRHIINQLINSLATTFQAKSLFNKKTDNHIFFIFIFHLEFEK